MSSQVGAQASLTISQLSAAINQHVLFEDIDLTLTSGQILWVSGQNGSGKSTFLKVVSGLTEVDYGQVLWRQTPISDSTAYQSERSYLAHNNGLKDQLTVLENIHFYLNLYQAKLDDIDDLLLKFDLLEHADTLCKQLSFGQKRRLALCRLLLADTTLWLLDEPYTGLDSQGRDYLTALCLNHIDNNGILILTHHGDLPPTIASHICQRIAL